MSDHSLTMTAELTLPKGGALPEGRVLVFEREGAVFANSRDVADYFGKRHDHVLQDIRHLVAEASPNLGRGPTRRMLLMRIYVFVSGKDPDVLAFTLNETGDNLPAALGPWCQEVIPGIYVIDIENDPISESVRLARPLRANRVTFLVTITYFAVEALGSVVN